MHKTLAALLSASMLTIGVGAEAAQDISRCNGILAANIQVSTVGKQSKLAWLRTINAENFEQRRQQAGRHLTYGDTDLGGTWDEFQQKRAALFSTERYDQPEDGAYAQLRSFVPDSARAAWLDCVRLLAKESVGLFVFVEREDATAVELRVSWKSPPPPPPPLRQARLQNQQLVGGRVEGLGPGQVLRPNTVIDSSGSRTILIERTGHQDVRGTLTFNGLSEEFFSAAVEKPGYSASVEMRGTGRIRTPFNDEKWLVHLQHDQCTETQYWRTFKYCPSNPRRTIEGLERAPVVVPIPNFKLEFQCFQPIKYRGQRVSDANSNCFSVDLLYKECASSMFGPQWRIEGCRRGTDLPGTPIQLYFHGTQEEPANLAPFRASANFETSATFQYPETQLVPGTDQLTFSHAVTVTNLADGQVTVLDDNSPAKNGFQLDVTDGGKTATIRKSGP
jgi:hypothetical protein